MSIFKPYGAFFGKFYATGIFEGQFQNGTLHAYQLGVGRSKRFAKAFHYSLSTISGGKYGANERSKKDKVKKNKA